MKKRRGSSRVFGGSREAVEAAAREIHRRLSEAGIPHAIIGGLAASAWSEPRATRDVDILLPSSARPLIGGGGSRVVGERVEGVSIRVQGTPVDLLFPHDDEGFLENVAATAVIVDGVPIATPDVIVYLKLGTGRARDENDILNMIRAGIDVDRVRRYLKRHDPSSLDDFEQLVAEADIEGA